MTESVTGLRHKIDSAQELESVVRSMKTIASSSIGQYEQAVLSLDDYYRTVQLGLVACAQQGLLFSSHRAPNHLPSNHSSTNYQSKPQNIGIIAFGSDQGLVGQFNEVMVDYLVETLASLPGNKTLWVVGERLQARLVDTPLMLETGFLLPNSIHAITTLVSNVLIKLEAQLDQGLIDQVYLFHHRPQAGVLAVSNPHQLTHQQLLPLDAQWQANLASKQWPTNNLPEIMFNQQQTVSALIREYLFVSIFRACAESLASENASRLAAMQRAEKNIEELQENLNRRYHRLRQSDIDEELFDVLSGYEAWN
ncbi:MAG: F0F1 ATP synthase subunit gamma [Oleibacter sp.]|nr:F0F1 ATP synthase subunit gamma [Thalassolituus sp.]